MPRAPLLSSIAGITAGAHKLHFVSCQSSQCEDLNTASAAQTRGCPSPRPFNVQLGWSASSAGQQLRSGNLQR